MGEIAPLSTLFFHFPLQTSVDCNCLCVCHCPVLFSHDVISGFTTGESV